MNRSHATKVAKKTEVQPTLVFFGARWCDPAVPMRVIFDEIIRALAADGVNVRAVVADIDEVEAILQQRADDAAAGIPASASDSPSLDSALTEDLVASVDFLPMIILVNEGEEAGRWVGQLPKRHIRAGIDAVLGA